MKKVGGLLFTILLLVVISQTDVVAQCAMCRASLENNVSNGDIGYAARLNYGILFLFALPYLLAITIGVLWYRKSKKARSRFLLAEKRRKKLARLGL